MGHELSPNFPLVNHKEAPVSKINAGIICENSYRLYTYKGWVLEYARNTFYSKGISINFQDQLATL